MICCMKPQCKVQVEEPSIIYQHINATSSRAPGDCFPAERKDHWVEVQSGYGPEAALQVHRANDKRCLYQRHCQLTVPNLDIGGAACTSSSSRMADLRAGLRRPRGLRRKYRGLGAHGHGGSRRGLILSECIRLKRLTW